MSKFRSFLWGIGVAALAYLLKSVTGPMIEKGMDEAKNLAEKGKSTIEEVKQKKEPKEQESDTQNQITVEVGQDPELEYEKKELLNQIEELKQSIAEMNEKVDSIGEGW